MKLIDILKTLPITVLEEHGPVISFGDIMQTCNELGQENHDLVEANLKDLEKQGLLTIVYMDEALIIGAKLKNQF